MEIRNFEGEQIPPDSSQGRGITATSDIIYRSIANPQQIATESIGTLERDHWRSVTLRANKHHLTAPKDAVSLQIATQSIGILERDHWRSVTLRANKDNVYLFSRGKNPTFASHV